MAIDFKEWTQDKCTYAIVPETISAIDVSLTKDENKISNEVNGYTKDRNMRKIGEVPLGVLYNYALARGVETTDTLDWYKDENGKHMKDLLNEFDVFRVDDSPLGPRSKEFKGFIIK